MPRIDLSLVDLPLESLTRVEHDGKKFVIVRTAGATYAYVDSCPHAFWPLSKGELRDGVLECPGHGWEFNVRTGRCLNAPNYCLHPVTLAVSNGNICLQWEDGREPASEACSMVTAKLTNCP